MSDRLYMGDVSTIDPGYWDVDSRQFRLKYAALKKFANTAGFPRRAIFDDAASRDRWRNIWVHAYFRGYVHHGPEDCGFRVLDEGDRP